MCSFLMMNKYDFCDMKIIFSNCFLKAVRVSAWLPKARYALELPLVLPDCVSK